MSRQYKSGRISSRAASIGVGAVSALALAIAVVPAAHGHEGGNSAAAGSVPVWVERTDDGQIDAVGFDLPLSMVEALDAADADAPPMTVMAREVFPDEVRSATSINHVSVDWAPFGHPPERYMVPHFDIHFYFDDPESVAAIDCADMTMPDPALLPDGFVLPPPDDPHACVPAMGVHAVSLAELQSDAPFDATMVLGYYGGRYTFLEPMVTQEHLLARQSFTIDIPPVADGTEAGQPRLVRFDYIEGDDIYRVALEGFDDRSDDAATRADVAQ